MVREIVFTALFVLLFVNLWLGVESVDDKVTTSERKRLAGVLLFFNFSYLVLTTLMVFAFSC